MTKLILASKSPRRRDFLATLNLNFEAIASDADETINPDLPLEEGICDVARRKALRVKELQAAQCWVLAADTVVVAGERLLGKPVDKGEAVEMLETLSGKAHRVITGVALVGPASQECFHVSTKVVFKALSSEMIEWYTSLEEPYDKAGAYAIQGAGAVLVKEIEGSYTNVVGLPLAETAELLAKEGLLSLAPRGLT